ncbi:spinster family MFS transporter [Blastomonas fulva]|uniref:spinster family MFS transporter n=1 Tax=Blastomonas fulva TaxID=1550728 RepID=UPI003F72E214
MDKQSVAVIDPASKTMPASESATSLPAERVYGPVYRAVLLTLILLTAAFAYIDRVIVQTLAEPIKQEFGLSDFQLGLLGGLSFAILYSSLGLPIARLAERKDRVTIISVSIGIFSIMSALCGFATSFWQLFAARVGVGIGEAGVQAPSASLIGDHFPPHRRGFALTIMRLGAPVGSVIGSVAAASIAAEYGWRTALMAVGVPGLVVALLFRLLLTDPPRGMSDPAAQRAEAAKPPPMMAVFRLLLTRPAFLHMLIGLALASMGLYAGGAFTTPFFMRVHSLTLAEAGGYLAFLSGIAATAGMSLGGFGIDFIARRGERWYALLPFWGLALSLPLYLFGYIAPDPRVSLVCLTIAGIFLFFHSVPTLVAFQNMVAANMRTTAAFVFFFVSTLIGVGFGPPIIGLVSDLYTGYAMDGAGLTALCAADATAAGCAAASAWGVRASLLTSLSLYAWAAVHYWIAARAIARDAVAA